MHQKEKPLFEISMTEGCLFTWTTRNQCT